MHEIVKKAIQQGYLLEPGAMDLLKDYGLPIAPYSYIKENESIQIPDTVIYPVVVKVVSPRIIHKSDVGGVKVNIQSRDELLLTINNMRENILLKVPDADIHGWKIHTFVQDGLEIILGAIEDRQFGMTLMLGIGGIFTEILNDTSFRVVPATEPDIDEMMNELKTQVFFKGFRSYEPLDRAILKQTLLGLNRMIIENPAIKEVDLNPVICNGPQLVPVDARIILSGQEAPVE